MAMSQSKHNSLLSSQTSMAKRVYDAVPIQEAWSVHQIFAAVTTANGGNSPEYKILSGCLNDLTDSKLIKREGRDFYIRAPIRAVSSQNESSAEEDTPIAPRKEAPAMHLVIAPELELTMSPENAKPVLSIPAPAKSQPAAPAPKVDALSALATVADTIATMATQLQSLASHVEDLALQLEQEREVVTRKAAEIEQLKGLMRSLSLDN